MRKFTSLIIAAILIFVFDGVVSASEKTLLFRLRYLEDPIASSVFIGNKKLGHAGVVRGLMDAATISQADFTGALEANSRNLSFERYWIANIVKVSGDSAELAELAQRPDVEEAFEDLPVELIAPVEIHENAIADIGHTAGLEAINASQVWELGLDGSGSLVCSFDTGVNGEHAALFSKYRGNNGGAADACWFDPYTHTDSPTDYNGHGTHTMGTMVGSDGTDTVGVAPGAQWIAAAVVDRGGGIERTISDILAAFQWAADPDGDPNTSDDVPDVVNNSWGIPLGYFPSCEATFWEAIDNLEDAGVVCVFAGGNEGPNPGTMRIPADRISSEFNAFSVGAVDGGSPDLPVAGFSSRGPSGCDHQSIKPEVTAPGVAILSASRTGGYALMSGTSMAAPHVSGAVAILRQFNPQATPDEIKQALMNCAQDLGQAGEDNDYGWGVIDIRRALDFMPAPEESFPVVVSSIISGDGIALPGERFGLGIIITNLGGAGSNINAHLSVSDRRVGILSGDLVINFLTQQDTVDIEGWEIQFSNELNYGEQVTFNLDLTIDGRTFSRHITVPVGDLNTSIGNEDPLPGLRAVISNYPNPFNSSTIIELGDEAGGDNTIMIFDSTGRLIKRIIAGSNRIIWDGSDSNGRTVAAGVYFVRQSGNTSTIGKMILLK